MTSRVFLLGHPVSQSLSPVMQNAAFSHWGLDWTYATCDVTPDELTAKLSSLEADPSVVGANVTVPHKFTVFAWLQAQGRQILPGAQAAGAVNTLVRGPDGLFQGDSTDFRGALAAIRQEAFAGDDTAFTDDLIERHVAILGTGGSAQSLALGLANLRNPPRTLTIFGRNPEKAAELAQALRSSTRGMVTADWRSLADFPTWNAGKFSLVIQTTTVGMSTGNSPESSPVPKFSLEPEQIAFDIVYKPHETLFLREAKAAGATVVHGIGMLVGQGALAQESWIQASAPATASEQFRLGTAMQVMANSLSQ